MAGGAEKSASDGHSDQITLWTHSTRHHFSVLQILKEKEEGGGPGARLPRYCHRQSQTNTDCCTALTDDAATFHFGRSMTPATATFEMEGLGAILVNNRIQSVMATIRESGVVAWLGNATSVSVEMKERERRILTNQSFIC